MAAGRCVWQSWVLRLFPILRPPLTWIFPLGRWAVGGMALIFLLLPQLSSASPKGPCDAFLLASGKSSSHTYSPTFSRNWLKFSKALAKGDPQTLPDLIHQYNLLRSDFKMDELLPRPVNHLLELAANAQSRLALNLLAKVYEIQNYLQVALWAISDHIDQIVLRFDLLAIMRELELARPYVSGEVVKFDVFIENLQQLRSAAIQQSDGRKLAVQITPLVKNLRQFFIVQDYSYLGAIAYASRNVSDLPQNSNEQLRFELSKIYQSIAKVVRIHPLRIRQNGHVLPAPLIDNPITNFLLHYYRYLVLWRHNFVSPKIQKNLNRYSAEELRQMAAKLPLRKKLKYPVVDAVYTQSLKTIDDFYSNYHSPSAITPREFMAWKKLNSPSNLTTALIELRAAHLLALQELDRGELAVPPELETFILERQKEYESLFWVEHHLNVLLNIDAVAFNAQAVDLAESWQDYWPSLRK
ncbi:MAG: hypothetical protein J6Y94_03370 [Bacteriovoracaceae bacterium]|nr:hypothetical protein [Bacteriovoracaceae bacterium]